MPEQTHHTDDAAPADEETVAAAAELFEDHPHVDDVDRDTARFPTRLGVTLRDASISRGIEELIEETNAHIKYADCTHAPDGEGERTRQYLELVVEEPLKPASRINVRRQNPSSLAVTIPREARELSGIGEGDEVEFVARNGEIRMLARD